MQRISVQLSNALDKSIPPISCDALISVEQPGLAIPQEFALRLCLEKIDTRHLISNGAEAVQVPQVGAVSILASKNGLTCSAIVWGKEVRIGTTLLSAMGWEELPGQGWIFTDKPIYIPTILPPKSGNSLNDSTI